jgi:secernin
VITDLVSEYGQGKFDNEPGVGTYDNGYIVADPTEAYVIETAAHEWVVKRVQSTIGISNIYSIETDYESISDSAVELAKGNGWWSSSGHFNFSAAFSADQDQVISGAARRKRSCAVLDRIDGGIGVDTMMSILRDHSDAANPEEPYLMDISHGGGICMHFNKDVNGKVNSGNTAASLIADLCGDGSRLPVYWCSFYSPCLSLFFPIFIEAELPGELARGGQFVEDDAQSPWWKFHRLNVLAREAGGEGVNLVRSSWDQLQGELMLSAYEIAAKARRQIEDGQSEQAEQMLTNYVTQNISIMLNMVDELIEHFCPSTPIIQDGSDVSGQPL